jgi:hypothetical protein
MPASKFYLRWKGSQGIPIQDQASKTETLSYVQHISLSILLHMRTAVAQWLRFCTTNRKVAGSIPNGVIGFSR